VRRVSDQPQERSAIVKTIWPNLTDEEFAKHDFEELIRRITWEMTDFAHNDRLPWWLCWQAALKAAAKFAVIESKTMNRPVQKIGPIWLMFVESETAELEKTFVTKVANDAG
jgi:hypothetical protein